MLMEYLAHHGILGQKWGVRRYQNADGTWTDAGKKRYGTNVDGSLSEKGKKRYTKDIKRALDRQNSDEFKAVMKDKSGSWDKSKATEHLHRNQREVFNKLNEEVRNSEESKALKKARDAFDKAEMNFLDNYGYDSTPNSKRESATAQKLAKAQNAYEKAESAYNKKLSDSWDKYYPEMMGAKLKDIGMADTQVGREIVTGLLRNDGWYRENNVYAKSSLPYDSSELGGKRMTPRR